MPPEPSQRHEDARLRAELADRAAAHEAVRAQELIDAFVTEANRRGIAPQPLQAQVMGGPQVRTDKQGWYLRKNRSIAIGTDGGYYVLTVPGSRLARFTGVRLQPAQPSLQVGRGGRDGETGDLAEFLRWRLDAG